MRGDDRDRSGTHFDGFCDSLQPEREIKREFLTDSKIEIHPSRRGEAGQLRRHFVRTGREIRKKELPSISADRRLSRIGGKMFHRDARAWQHTALFVDHDSPQRSQAGLSRRPRWRYNSQQNQHDGPYPTERSSRHLITSWRIGHPPPECASWPEDTHSCVAAACF